MTSQFLMTGHSDDWVITSPALVMADGCRLSVNRSCRSIEHPLESYPIFEPQVKASQNPRFQKTNKRPIFDYPNGKYAASAKHICTCGYLWCT
jgi:hypothetical protein